MMDLSGRFSSADFKLKEIKYYIPYFRAQRSDQLATIVIEDIKLFLDAQGDYTQILSYLEELEVYADESSSINYVWALVEVRRQIQAYYDEKGNYEEAFKQALISAKHFDNICRLYPSAYHLCCRINENLNATEYAKKTNGAALEKHLEKIYEYCHRLVEEYEEEQDAFYYSEARRLYLKWYLFIRERETAQDQAHDCLLKFIEFSTKCYAIQENSDVLRLILIGYVELSGFKKFSYERVKSGIHCALDWAKEAMASGRYSLRRNSDSLMELVKKYESATSAV